MRRMRSKNIKNQVRKNKFELITIFAVFFFAAILTIFQPISGETVSYFGDIMTPLLLLFAIVMICVLGRRVI